MTYSNDLVLLSTGLPESTPPVPQRVRLHMLLVCGPDPSGFDKSLEVHMAGLTPDQAENWHLACRTSAFAIKTSKLDWVGA